MKTSKLLYWFLGGSIVFWVWTKYTTSGANVIQQITEAGVNMIAQFEGFSDKAYNDPPGSDKFSIGFGHQIQPGEPYMTYTMTVAEGRALLAQDTANAQSTVRSVITYPLNAAQFDALTSFVYNLGAGAFKSGTLPTKINAGNLQAAAMTILQYNKVRQLDGTLAVNDALTTRRQAEAAAFA